MDFDEREQAKFSLRRGDVLVCEGGEPGRAAVWNEEISPCFFQKALHRLRPLNGAILPQYVVFALWSAAQAGTFRDSLGQATIAHLPAITLAALEIPLPPLGRQREIVQRLDNQLASAAHARAAVAAQLAEAEKLRPAFIAQTFSSIRTSHRAKLIDLVASPLRTGTSKPAMPGSAFRCLTLSAVRHGALDFEASKPVDLTPEESAKSQVRSGAFYVVRGNGNKSLVGRGGLAPVTPPSNMAFPDLLFEVQPDATKLRPDFLRWAWDSSEVREQIEDAAATAAGIYKINQRNLGAVTLPVPTLAKQEEIAARLNQENAASRAVIGHLTARLADLDLLSGALLRAAFTF